MAVWLLALVLVQASCKMLANAPPQSSRKSFDLALDAYVNSNFSASLSELNKEIALDSNSAVLFHARANAYYELGDYEKAIADYSRAIELKPDSASVFSNRALAYKRIGKLKLASSDFDRCWQILRLPARQ